MSDNRHVNDYSLVMLVKIILVAAIVYPIVHYTILHNTQDVDSNLFQGQVNNASAANSTTTKQVEIILQPSCPASYALTILRKMCSDLAMGHLQCTPEDFVNLDKHKPPKPHAKNNTTSEQRGTIVGCIAAGLLLTSLGAAFLELYKAKSQTPVKATKTPMSRKCSLADLTVLKHTRKELVRRESIMEVPEMGGAPKPLGFKPRPLYRRCSFPVGPSEMTNPPNSYVPIPESRRTSMESRRLSIVDSRRSSVDCRQIDNESPERRHWSRLVHRH